ncbi:MAG: hypothetical protein M0C28_03535 [Candidatus Moduliflexus flocculans]|nr:hypothetical protein [Candidatus Moduliflexus flocculans]
MSMSCFSRSSSASSSARSRPGPTSTMKNKMRTDAFTVDGPVPTREGRDHGLLDGRQESPHGYRGRQHLDDLPGREEDRST